MASIDVGESSKTSRYKKIEESLEQHAETPLPKYHQNFFTILDDKEDEDFLPELITTGKDPQNHNIEVEMGRDEERRKRNIAGRTGRGNLGLKPSNPLPFIKVDLNKNYKTLEAMFAEFKEFPDVPDFCLKTAEPVHNDPGFLPPGNLSNKAFTFGLSQTGGLPASNQYSSVFGADINDIPTAYDIPKLAAHELPVVGTFVHGKIIPGFPYRVRLNGTSSEFLFGGNVLVLEAIGQGYGKRLSFESDDLLYGKNYFWSDNNPPHGYALSIGLTISGEFEVKNENEKLIGNVMVKAVHDHQVIHSVRCFQDCIQIAVQVNMVCSLASLPNKDTTERILGGIAIATKRRKKIEVDAMEKVSIVGFEDCFQLRKVKQLE